MTGLVEPQPWKRGSDSEELPLWLENLQKTGFAGEFRSFDNSPSRASYFLNHCLYRILPHALWFPLFRMRWRKHTKNSIMRLRE